MNDVMQTWTRVHQSFDPIQPASAELRVAREQYNPLSEKIAPRLKLHLKHQKFVLAGGIGSGKSTELRATAGDLANDKIVVLVDLWQHFESTVLDPGAIDHLHPAELAGLLGLAVLRVGSEVFGHDWRGLAGDLGDAIQAIQSRNPGKEAQATLDTAQLAKGVALVVGGATLLGAGTALTSPTTAAIGVRGVAGGLTPLAASTVGWLWKVGQRGRGPGSDQDAPIRAAISATNALLDDLRRAYGRDIVLLVDGLDRVQDASTFENLFVESSLINDLRCDLVTTLGLGLVQRYSNRLRCGSVHTFAHVPVALQADPTQRNPVGMAFFKELAAKRLRECKAESAIPSAQIETLAYYSGGRLRDFISLIREIAVQAMLSEVAVTTDEHVRVALDQFRRTQESGLNRLQIDLMRAVLADPERRLPAGDVALDLLGRQLLLAYPNENEWYLPHPILMLSLLRPIGTDASA